MKGKVTKCKIFERSELEFGVCVEFEFEKRDVGNPRPELATIHMYVQRREGQLSQSRNEALLHRLPEAVPLVATRRLALGAAWRCARLHRFFEEPELAALAVRS